MELRIKNVSKSYSNGVNALKDVSLEIPVGMFGLLGPNGAGKSSLMRMLATLQEPDEGEVFLGPINLLQQKEEIRRTLGYLPQNFGILKSMSAIKLLNHFAVLEGISKKGERKDVVEYLLRQTNLWEVRHQNLGGFSGGMKQRFGIAVALLGDPKLMIVDEPTAGLDPAERVRFLNLLSELGEKSVVILSTHIVEDVSELCTKMAVIEKGTILLEAEPKSTIEELEGKIWKRMVGKPSVTEIEKDYNLVSTKMFGGERLVRIFSDEDPMNDFEPCEPSLEDVYFSTMAGYYSIDKSRKRTLL